MAARRKTCSKCGASKALAQFPADRRRSDNLSDVCIGCREFSEPLETVDLSDVEIMSEGGPYHGKGSPPEGDFFDRARLEKIAEAGRGLAAELKPPSKLGHSKEQKLLAASGLALDEGEEPAAGWVDGSSLEVVERDGKAKLIGAVRKVPARLASLFEAGSFRTRSAELGRVTAQDGSGKVYDEVLTGLAWLGAKRPAIRTLDDWIGFAFSEDDEVTITSAVEYLTAPVPDEIERTVDFATAATVAWDPEAGFSALSMKLSGAINPKGPPGGEMPEPTYYVIDVASAGAIDAEGDRQYLALVQSWADGNTWRVGFDVENGEANPDPSDSWIPVEQSWVEASTELAENFVASRRGNATSGDTRSQMLTDDQIKTFAETFGIEEEDADKRRELVLAQFAEHVPAPKTEEKDVDPKTEETPDPPTTTLSEKDPLVVELRTALAEQKAERDAERVAGRDRIVKGAIRARKIDPADTKKYEDLYDANSSLCVEILESLPVNEDLPVVYGSDEPGDSTEFTDEQYAAHFRAMYGEPVTGAVV